MKKLLLTTSAALAIASGAAIAQTDAVSENSAAAKLFNEIDTNNDDEISRTEFVTFGETEYELSSDTADELFDNVAGDDDILTLTIVETSAPLAEWRNDQKEVEVATVVETTKTTEVTTEQQADGDLKTTKTVAQSASISSENVDKASEKMSAEDVSNGSNSADADRQAGLASSSPAAADIRDDDQRSRQQASATDTESETNVQNANFLVMDKDKNGRISKDEFITFMSDADNIDRNEASREFDAAAGDDKILTFAEFIDEDTKLETMVFNTRHSAAADPDSDKPAAHLGSLQLAEPLDEDRKPLSNRDYDRLFVQIDENDDGKVHKSEYLEYVRAQAEKRFDALAGSDKAITKSEMRSASNEDLMHRASLEE